MACPTSMGLWPATPRPYLSGPGLGPKETRRSRRHRPGRQARWSSRQDAGDPPRPHSRARAQHRPELPPRRGGGPTWTRPPTNRERGWESAPKPTQPMGVGPRPPAPPSPRSPQRPPGPRPRPGRRHAGGPPPTTSLTLVERERSSLVADAGSCSERTSHRLHGRCTHWPAPLESWRTPPARLDGT